MRALRPLDDAVQVGTDLVGAALLEVVAGVAGLGAGLALLDVGAGEADGDRLDLGLGRRGGGLRLRLGQVVAGFARRLRVIDQFGDETRSGREQKGAEDCTQDLVHLERVHALLATRPCRSRA
jgi:hypothetical protein